MVPGRHQPFLAGMGVLWAGVGSFDPLGVYDHYFARAFSGRDTLPPDARTAFRFILGPFGATSAGYFTLQYCIARRAQWAYGAIFTAFARGSSSTRPCASSTAAISTS